MRPSAFIIVVALASCSYSERPSSPAPPTAPTSPATTPSNGAVTYDPATFRADVTRLIAAKQYRSAVALVRDADLQRQLAADGDGYVAIAMYMILLPGVYPQVEYDRSRDWDVPGTSDAIEDAEWQAVATDFAERYNLRRCAEVDQQAR